MSLVNWLCSLHQTVSLDHWSSGECSIYSGRVINTILAKEQGDSNHQGYTLTPTTVLACPRQILIERFLPYAASPDSLITMSVGTWAHTALNRLAVPVKGTLFGHDFVGEIDAVDGGILEEDKFTGASSMGWRVKHGPSTDHIAQVSMYAILHEQAYNIIDECAINYYCVGGTKGKPSYMRFTIKPMTEKELLRYKPFGGDQSIEENLGQLVRAFKAIKGGAEPVDIIRTLPLAGATMFRGKKCTDYCTVNKVCLNDIEGRTDW